MELLYYILSNILSKLITGLSGIFLARYFSKVDYGILASAFAFMNIASLFSKFGTTDFFLYRLSSLKDPRRQKVLFAGVFTLSLYSYLIFIPATIIPAYMFLPISQYPSAGDIHPIIPIYAKTFFDGLLPPLFIVVLQHRNRFGVLSLFGCVASLVVVLNVFAVYLFHLSLNGYLFFSLMTTAVFAAAWSLSASKLTGYNPLSGLDLRIRAVLDFAPEILRSSYHFFVSNIMAFVYVQSDILMLSILKGPVETARYSVVVSLLLASYLIPSSISSYFLPKLITAFSERSGKTVSSILRQFAVFTLPVMFLISPALFFFPNGILNILFGGKYNDSGNILRLLSVVLFFHSTCFISGAVLTAASRQKTRSNIQIAGAVFNIAANFIFIPFYGAEGAAFTTALTEVIIFGLYSYFSIKILRTGGA